jgi:hypothetical protein
MTMTMQMSSPGPSFTWSSTEHARQLGASVLLAPREGPAGWHCVVSAPQCGELALWQPKR